MHRSHLTVLTVLSLTLNLFAQSLKEQLKPFVDSNLLAGAVMMIGTTNAVLTTETIGFADIAGQKPMKPDTTFWIASQTKAMTCAAMMILVDQKKISLDDPLTNYLPIYQGIWKLHKSTNEWTVFSHPKTPITIRHLMSNTAGFPFKAPVETKALDTFPIRATATFYAMTPLEFEPGTQYLYSNLGFNICGYIIERVSGMSYETFMQKNLFLPLRMNDTTFVPTMSSLNRLAKTYALSDDGKKLLDVQTEYLTFPLDNRVNRYPMPAGGLFSTAENVLHFYQMLAAGGVYENRRILSEESVRAMTSKQTGENVKTDYGFGLNIDSSGFGHGGALGTSAKVFRKNNTIAIWMVQRQGSAAAKHAQEALNVFLKYVEAQP